MSDDKVEFTRICHEARLDSNKMAFSLQEQVGLSIFVFVHRIWNRHNIIFKQLLLNELEMDRKMQNLSQALLYSSEEIDKIINRSC